MGNGQAIYILSIMTGLDYHEICREVLEDRPEGFSVSKIVVNLDHLDIDVPRRLHTRIFGSFHNVAMGYLQAPLLIEQNDSLDELWTYELECKCGQTPLFDESSDEYYCPFCKDEQSVFDY